jgi:hypothetical protein
MWRRAVEAGSAEDLEAAQAAMAEHTPEEATQ